MSDERRSPEVGGDGARVQRHRLINRCFHWLSAASVIVLMATALLPILGLDFSWVTAHWIAGLALTALVAAHTVQALFWRSLATIWVSLRDVRRALRDLRGAVGRSMEVAKIEGKYSIAQKAIHNAFAVVIITAVATGCAMLVKIDTPLWDRDPYWLSDASWGVIYVLHDFASLCLVTMLMLHVYFALRPEKLYLMRSMLRGWISIAEYEQHYDTAAWQADRD